MRGEQRRTGFTLAQTGDASLNQMANELAKSDLERAEIFGMPVALIVLLLVFGAVLAAFMPLVLSVISIVLAVALTGLIGQVYPMNTFVLNILTMMGLAVGIDYTLFIISRYREERARGLEKIDAIAATGATANRAIFFSGMTVVLAMVGHGHRARRHHHQHGPRRHARRLHHAAHLADPAAGDPRPARRPGQRAAHPVRRPPRRAARRRPRGRLGAARPQHHAAAGDLARRRRPSCCWPPRPVLLMKTGNNGASAANFPDDQYAKQGWDILGRDFSLGKANPVQIVVDGPAGSAAVKDGVDRLETALKADGRFGPAQVVVEQGRRPHARLHAAGRRPRRRRDPDGRPRPAQRRRPGRLRRPAPATSTSPATRPASSTTSPSSTSGCRSPLAVVLSLSFVLLLLAFRSVVIPAKAILMNLLSVGAAYGLLVLVFQKGVGAGLLGLHQVDTIEAWVPLMLFSLLFGLSMDYQVFLLSRIKERFDHTGDTREAVGYGVGRTAGIITGAAAIMVCVFAGMAGGDLVMFQQMGFGLAVAIFIDATIVRTIIVPAAMELLGDWNWYLPRWLEWLPNVSVEGHVPPALQPEPGDAPALPGADGAAGGPAAPHPAWRPAPGAAGASGGK